MQMLFLRAIYSRGGSKYLLLKEKYLGGVNVVVIINGHENLDIKAYYKISIQSEPIYYLKD